MNDIERDLPFWIAFSQVPTVGRVRIGALEQRFDTLENAWAASEGQLRSAGLDANVVSSIVSSRREIDPSREHERVMNAGVRALTWHDADYPTPLRDIDDLPPVIYIKGTYGESDRRSVTVVGTRRPTAYGKEAATHLAGDLAKAGVTVVSGLARGIDSVAHRASLAAGGRTLAVLGSGLDVVYPPEHARLLDEIVEQGAALSEFALGTKPEARNFPRRNRLLSGLSLATLVIEAGEGSGTLSTVRFALEQNRDVFCVPGSIYSPASRLTNRLVQEGAKLVMDVDDVLEELSLAVAPEQQLLLPEALAVENEDEAAVLNALEFEPVHIDELSRATGLPITRVVSALMVMEIKGQVWQVGRMNYIRAREAGAARHSTQRP